MIIYSSSPTIIEGNTQKVVVTDDTSQILLSDILKELKKANLHYSLITDEVINNTEVEI